MDKIQVTDGMYGITFSGREIARVTTEQPGGLRWVEMELYWAEPGQDESVPMLQLPEGGYVTHIIGQSLVAHKHNSFCKRGVQVHVNEMIADALPCPDCTPQFPVMKNIDPRKFEDEDLYLRKVAEEEERVLTARKDNYMLVDLESPRHSVHRAKSAPEAVRQIIGPHLSWPAERLLSMARKADPKIDAVFDSTGAA